MKNLKKLTALLLLLSLSPISLVVAADDELGEDDSALTEDELAVPEAGSEDVAEDALAEEEAPDAVAPAPAPSGTLVTAPAKKGAAPKAAANKKNKKNRRRWGRINRRRLRARRAKAQARKAGFGPAASRKKLAAANRKNAADSLRKELE